VTVLRQVRGRPSTSKRKQSLPESVKRTKVD